MMVLSMFGGGGYVSAQWRVLVDVCEDSNGFSKFNEFLPTVKDSLSVCIENRKKTINVPESIIFEPPGKGSVSINSLSVYLKEKHNSLHCVFNI